MADEENLVGLRKGFFGEQKRRARKQKKEIGTIAAAMMEHIGDEKDSSLSHRDFFWKNVCVDAIGIKKFPSSSTEAKFASETFVSTLQMISNGKHINFDELNNVKKGTSGAHRIPELYNLMIQNAAEELRNQEYKRSNEHFVDLDTGIRMRYLDSTCIDNRTDNNNILFIHDLGDNASCFHIIIEELFSFYRNESDRMQEKQPFNTYCIDLRGHGKSSSSLSSDYNSKNICDDVLKFILHSDLYKRRFTVVGHGLGAVIAAQMTKLYPKLFNGIAMLDPPYDISLLRFHPFQSANFRNYNEAMMMIVEGYKRLDDVQNELARPRNSKKKRSNFRNLDGLARDTLRTLKSAKINQSFFQDDLNLRLNMDSLWCMNMEQNQWESSLSRICCPILILRGEHSHWCSDNAIQNIEDIIQSRHSIVSHTISKASHWILADNPKEVGRRLYKFVDNLFYGDNQAEKDEGYRRAENLGIRPLDQFNTIEEAMKRLGPRTIPKPASIRQALKQLKADERGINVEEVSDDDDDDHVNVKRMTKLAKEDPQYFGYVT